MRYLAKKLTLKSSSSPIVDFELNFRVFAKLQLTRTEFGVRPTDEVVTHTLLHHHVRGIRAVPSQGSVTALYLV